MSRVLPHSPLYIMPGSRPVEWISGAMRVATLIGVGASPVRRYGGFGVLGPLGLLLPSPGHEIFGQGLCALPHLVDRHVRTRGTFITAPSLRREG